MALTPSTMLPWGTRAPDFRLPDAVSGRPVALGDFAPKPVLVVLFICNHCPYVKHIRAGLAAFGRDYQPKGVGVVAISANDVAEYPEDGPAKMKAEAKAAGYTFPYLFDETQAVARAYDAVCTPEFYGITREGIIAYHGRLDEGRKNEPPVGARRELVDAMRAIARTGKGPDQQFASVGCSIKWRNAA